LARVADVFVDELAANPPAKLLYSVHRYHWQMFQVFCRS
jgi:hypothetical protein